MNNNKKRRFEKKKQQNDFINKCEDSQVVITDEDRIPNTKLSNCDKCDHLQKQLNEERTLNTKLKTANIISKKKNIELKQTNEELIDILCENGIFPCPCCGTFDNCSESPIIVCEGCGDESICNNCVTLFGCGTSYCKNCEQDHHIHDDTEDCQPNKETKPI
jgi:hypothetical protein